MKSSMDLQSILLEAANQNRERPDLESTVDEHPQPTGCGQSPPGDEPSLPEGYRPVRDAIQALLTYAPEEKSVTAARPQCHEAGKGV